MGKIKEYNIIYVPYNQSLNKEISQQSQDAMNRVIDLVLSRITQTHPETLSILNETT